LTSEQLNSHKKCNINIKRVLLIFTISGILADQQNSKQFFFGTSGLVVPIPQSQYPTDFEGKSRLCYYSSLFNSLEVNSSFYKHPRPVTVEKWASETGDQFRFTFKIPNTISHAKELKFDPKEVGVFLSIMGKVGSKKGCLLIQLPPALTIDATPQLSNLLDVIKQNHIGQSWRIAVEFRHTSWYVKETVDLLGQHQACTVIHDLPKSKTPIPIDEPFSYLRFHGEGGRYRGSYSRTELQPYAELIKKSLAAGQPVYCYFNNTMGDAFANAKTLEALVALDGSTESTH
jgi:uncharacterized protein YecE (DUF72 family)